MQLLERLADLALPLQSRPSSRPQIDQRRVSARRAVEGAHAAQHARFGRERAQLARLVVPIRMLDKLAPQLCAQVRPHLGVGSWNEFEEHVNRHCKAGWLRAFAPESGVLRCVWAPSTARRALTRRWLV